MLHSAIHDGPKPQVLQRQHDRMHNQSAKPRPASCSENGTGLGWPASATRLRVLWLVSTYIAAASLRR